MHKAIIDQDLWDRVQGRLGQNRVRRHNGTHAKDQERLIIPIVYRDNYLSALRALTQNANSIPLIRMLDYVQAYTHAIDWSDLDNATATLERTYAFADPEEARLIMPGQVPTT